MRDKREMTFEELLDEFKKMKSDEKLQLKGTKENNRLDGVLSYSEDQRKVY